MKFCGVHMTEWVSLVRSGGSGVKIVPRMLLEGWTMADFQEVFASEAAMTQVAEFIVRSLQVSTDVNILTHVPSHSEIDGTLLCYYRSLASFI